MTADSPAPPAGIPPVGPDSLIDVPFQSNPAKRYDAFISYNQGRDAALAQALQVGLQRLAKPWYQRRAIEVFRDKTGLSANSGLWPSLCEKLDGSRFILVMCSTAAAGSVWVGHELRRWVRHHDRSTVLLVLTDGELVWDPQRGDYDPVRSTALHPALRGVFRESGEPLHVDLREVRDDIDLTISGNPQLRTAVAQLAGRVRGQDPGDLDGLDVRLNRRALMLARGAVVALSVLVLAAGAASVVAVAQAREATTQRDRATAETLVAVSRNLAAQSLLWTGQRRLLLAVEAYRTSPTLEARSALFGATADPGTAPGSNDAQLVSTLFHEGAVTSASFSPSGTTFAAADTAGTVRIWPVAEAAAPITAAVGGALIAFAGDDRLAVVDGTELRWVDVGDGSVQGDPVTLPAAVTAIASGTTGALLGTTSGEVGQLSPQTPWQPSAERHEGAVAFIGASADGVTIVSADDTGETLVRDGTDLSVTGSWVEPEWVTRAVSPDGTSALVTLQPAAVLEYASSTDDGYLLAAVVSTDDQEIVREIRTPDPQWAVAGGFTEATGDEAVVLAYEASITGVGQTLIPDRSRPLVYRSDSDSSGPLTPQPAASQQVDEPAVAYPDLPTTVVTARAGGRVAVTGYNVTAISAPPAAESATGPLPWLSGPVMPVSVAPDTGELLISTTSGLALADMTAAPVPDPSGIDAQVQPVRAIGFTTQDGWVSPDGRLLLVGETTDGEDAQLVPLADPEQPGWAVPEVEWGVRPAMSLDGRRLAYALPPPANRPDQTQLVIIDTTDGTTVAVGVLDEAVCGVECSEAGILALSPDGRYLAVRTAEKASAEADPSGYRRPNVILLDTSTTTWTELARYEAVTTTVPTFGTDGRLRFHDGIESTYVVDPTAPTAAQVQFDLASDEWVLDGSGRPVATASCDITILDRDSGQQLGSAIGASPSAADCTSVEVRWLESTRSLLVVEEFGRVYTLPTDVDALLTRACAVAGRNLRPSEWVQFLPGEQTYRTTCPDQPVPAERESGGAFGSPTATPTPTATTTVRDDPTFPLELETDVPAPPWAPTAVPADFPGREVALGFVEQSLLDDGGDPADAADQLCFLRTDTTDQDQCVGVVHSSAERTVLAIFVGPEPVTFLLILPPTTELPRYEVASAYQPSVVPGDPPDWVTQG